MAYKSEVHEFDAEADPHVKKGDQDSALIALVNVRAGLHIELEHHRQPFHAVGFLLRPQPQAASAVYTRNILAMTRNFPSGSQNGDAKSTRSCCSRVPSWLADVSILDQNSRHATPYA
mmetsp:Transcript_25631/g.63998  ORF Transcript_25631/g.63998 Transcript_25631/m.63998 type:complete len:118 (-) Transcript_25631:915-1268(-)